MNGTCEIENCDQLAHVYWKPGKNADEKGICKTHWKDRDGAVDLFKLFGACRTEQATYTFVNSPPIYSPAQSSDCDNRYDRLSAGSGRII